MMSVNNRNGQRIFSSDRGLDNFNFKINEPTTIRITIPKNTLTSGNYSFFIAIHCPNTIGYEVVDNICPISIFDNGSEFVQYENKWFYGDVFVPCKWDLNLN